MHTHRHSTHRKAARRVREGQDKQGDALGFRLESLAMLMRTKSVADQSLTAVGVPDAVS